MRMAEADCHVTCQQQSLWWAVPLPSASRIMIQLGEVSEEGTIILQTRQRDLLSRVGRIFYIALSIFYISTFS